MHGSIGILDALGVASYRPRPKSFRAKKLKPKRRSRLSKRSFDIVGSLLLLALFFPLMCLVALLVALSSDGPILYRQRRVTAGGREFSMFKFRSMYQNAESTGGEIWCSENDKRVTPIGRVLRRYHIDELPQLFNVLCGSMSLVGPRPERPGFSQMLHSRYRSFDRRLQVPAGLTGLAQVHQGYCSSVENYRRKVALDRLYVHRRSLKLDCVIALRTVYVVLNGKEHHG